MKKNRQLKTIEFFAGIGGVTGGFADTGKYIPVFLNDIDSNTKKAFEVNFPEYASAYNTQKIEELVVDFVKEFTNDQYDGILGCPPCQGFSMAGLRKKDDPRNKLIREFQRLILGLKPKFFVMENVPSLINSTYYQEFFEVIGKIYNISADVLNAAEFGIPQYRRRAVVLGLHKDLKIFPSLPHSTHGGAGTVFDYYIGDYVDIKDIKVRKSLQLKQDFCIQARPLVTLKDALGDLPETLSPGEEVHEYADTPKTPYQALMRKNEKPRLYNHKAWEHSDELVLKLSQVIPGDCPQTDGRRNRNTKYFSQAYSRLHPQGLSRTLTTNFANPGGGRYTHYSCPRTLTIREALRIQSFPDDFVFDTDIVHATHAKTMIGNAFPRLLAEKIANHISQYLQ